MIPELLKPGMIDATTRLVLTNAVYFKGKWVKEFVPQQTKQEPFTPETGPAISTPLMHQSLYTPYAELSDAQVLELPYKTAGTGPRLVMDLILPKDPAGLAAVERNLGSGGVAQYVGSFSQSLVNVTLPRFKLSWTKSLNEPLKLLGMRKAFHGSAADFSGLARGEKLYIDLVQHEAVVEVNEEGTKAAAVTAGVAAAISLPMPSVFRADRPFLFLLRDAESGLVLFLGRLARPS
jgi:serpin B